MNVNVKFFYVLLLVKFLNFMCHGTIISCFFLHFISHISMLFFQSNWVLINVHCYFTFMYIEKCITCVTFSIKILTLHNMDDDK